MAPEGTEVVRLASLNPAARLPRMKGILRKPVSLSSKVALWIHEVVLRAYIVWRLTA